MREALFRASHANGALPPYTVMGTLMALDEPLAQGLTRGARLSLTLEISAPGNRDWHASFRAVGALDTAM